MDDDYRRTLSEAATLERSGQYQRAAELMLSVLRAASGTTGTTTTPTLSTTLDLRALRLATARVLECAEAAHGWEDVLSPSQLRDDDFEAVVRDEPEEHALSPLAQWLQLHPPPPPPKQRICVVEAADEFVVVDVAPLDWILVDDDKSDASGNNTAGARATVRGCLECGVRKGLLVDASCADCGGQYCGAHAQLLEGGSRCLSCALHNEQTVGASRTHADKYLFCRRIFSARAAARLQFVRSRVAAAAVPVAVASSTSFQLLSMAPAWSPRVLCHVCSGVTTAAQHCKLCEERCCPQCTRTQLLIDDVYEFCGRDRPQSTTTISASTTAPTSPAVVLERSCAPCHALVVRHTRTLARVGVRKPTHAHAEMMAVYDRMRVAMGAIEMRLAQLELQLSLWQQSDGLARHREQCVALSRELDALFVQLAGGARWLRDHKDSGGRLVAIISAAVAEFYGDTSQRLRTCQAGLK